MPTYHYRCSRCEQHLEVVQSMTDDPITECAACGGEMQKVLQPVGIVLKGSGFYRTDSRSGSKRTSKSDKSDKSDKSEKSDSKGDGNGSSSDSKSTSTSSSSATKGTEAKSA